MPRSPCHTASLSPARTNGRVSGPDCNSCVWLSLVARGGQAQPVRTEQLPLCSACVCGRLSVHAAGWGWACGELTLCFTVGHDCPQASIAPLCWKWLCSCVVRHVAQSANQMAPFFCSLFGYLSIFKWTSLTFLYKTCRVKKLHWWLSLWWCT